MTTHESSSRQGNAWDELLHCTTKTLILKGSKRQCNVENVILKGDALSTLKTLPSESVDMVITSPPYWGLRDYGVEGQLGQETDFRDFIKHLADIFDEVKRVLKSGGTCWVNLGDSYGGTGDKGKWTDPKYSNGRNGQSVSLSKGVMQKSLMNIPARFAIEMTDRGWLLRNEIIWHKPNQMPSSVKDRFSVDFEKLFFFTKSKRYDFRQQTERTGRNKRSVWAINTRPFAEAHFAVYPEDLIETPILAGCPIKGTVLDPFFGSGTTGVVAMRLDRKYVGIELNPEYIEIAEKRLAKAQIQRNALLSQLPLEA